MRYVSRAVRRKKALREAAKLGDTEFIDHVVQNIKTNMSASFMKEIIQIGNSLKDVLVFRNTITNIMVSTIDELKARTYGGHGNEIPQSLRIVENYFTQEQKNKIADSLIREADKFYPYARKQVVDVATDFIQSGDSRAFSILTTFLRVIENKTLEKLLAKIEGGIDNPDVKTILSKTKVLSYAKYDETEVKNNPEVRRALIKEIANTSSIAKKIPFEVDVSIDDIRAIAPAARLSFLQFAFDPEIKYARRALRSNYYYDKFIKDKTGALLAVRTTAKLNNLKMPKIDKETAKELLFSVSLQKNDEMNAWFNDYSNYLDLVNGKAKPPQKINNYY